MPIRATVVGSYPKVTESGSDNLPGVIDRWQRQLVPSEALEQELQKVIRRVIREQEEAGLDLVTDGQIRWEDLPHPAVRDVQGVRRGTLRRFFDNNVYYRRLELDGEIAWSRSAVAEEFAFASKIARRPVKAVLPGPLTLMISTEPKPGQTREGLLSLYTDLLRKEVEALEKAGAKEIQLDEPAFAAGEPLLDQAVGAIHRVLEGVKARRWVAVYFQDPVPILPTLAKLRVEVLSLDLVSAREKVTNLLPRVVEGLKGGAWKGELALGLVDGRNTKLEDPQDLARQVKAFFPAVPADRLWLSPNCGLEFLPHAPALKKLQVLKQAATYA